MKSSIIMLLYMLIFINRTILGDTATAPAEIAQQTNILLLIVPVLIVIVVAVLLKSGKKTDSKAEPVSEKSADKDGTAQKQPDVEEKKQPVPEKSDAGKKTQKNAAIQEKPEISPLSRLAALEAEAEEASDKKEGQKPVERQPAPEASSGGAKRTLKNKAVAASPLAGRLGDIDAAEKPSQPPQPTAPEKKPAIVPAVSIQENKPLQEVMPGAAENPVVSSSPEAPEPVATVTPLVQPKERLVFALEGDGKPYEAQGSVIRVGRKKENQICIPANEVSREHIEVTASKGLVYVMPLTETNTTRLNGRSIKDKQLIKPGDTLNLGGLDFIVVKARAL